MKNTEQPEDSPSPEELPPALQEPTQIRSGFAGAGSPEEAAWILEEDEEMFRQERIREAASKAEAQAPAQEQDQQEEN